MSNIPKHSYVKYWIRGNKLIQGVEGTNRFDKVIATTSLTVKNKNMYVYIRTEPTLWTVGFYKPDGQFEPESDHDNPESAANRVAFLNGKNHN